MSRKFSSYEKVQVLYSIVRNCQVKAKVATFLCHCPSPPSTPTDVPYPSYHSYVSLWMMSVFLLGGFQCLLSCCSNLLKKLVFVFICISFIHSPNNNLDINNKNYT